MRGLKTFSHRSLFYISSHIGFDFVSNVGQRTSQVRVPAIKKDNRQRICALPSPKYPSNNNNLKGYLGNSLHIQNYKKSNIQWLIETILKIRSVIQNKKPYGQDTVEKRLSCSSCNSNSTTTYTVLPIATRETEQVTPLRHPQNLHYESLWFVSFLVLKNNNVRD